MRMVRVLVILLVCASTAGATVIDLVAVDIGKSGGRLGNWATGFLRPSDTIGLKIVLNHNPYPNYPSYDGYLLNNIELSLHVIGPASLAFLQDKTGNPIWKKHANFTSFNIQDDGTVANGLDRISGLASPPIAGQADLMWNLLLHNDGGDHIHGPLIGLDLRLEGPSQYAPYTDEDGGPYPGWAQLTNQDLGDWGDVPEPGTIAILGLGGLVVRCKRR